MFEQSNVRYQKQDNYIFYRIQVKGFDIQKSMNNLSIEEFLKIANQKYFDKFGIEATSIPKTKEVKLDPITKRPVSEYEMIIKNRFSSINQRCKNGKYCNNKSVLKNNQHRSYHKKGIMLEMSFDEFRDWMMSVKHIHDEIVRNGDKSSINRIDNRKGYSVDNIELITLHKNIEERYGFECEYISEQNLSKKSVYNHNRYVNSQRREGE